ncbi:MAG: 4-hydroxythreonine-4-phosphate dehydrogenase PdxA [Elusimicrobiota bacterium]|jgi:4-hydroxythreonine-4-phosphate dehydrogenase|nr:4-hydroxythreonine-4-phosphate dehydrogenase PdxA [Elusimicrobiota bacterium]
MKRFAFTMGDPCGIGAEIIVKALKTQPEYIDESVVFGNVELLKHYAQLLALKTPVRSSASLQDTKAGFVNVFDSLPHKVSDFPIGKASKIGGECAFCYFAAALKEAIDKNISFIATAPLNKEALQLAGHFYAGHTEIAADFCKSSNFAMLLWSDKLKAIHATTHIPLRQVFSDLTAGRIIEVTSLANDILKKMGYKTPRIAVCGLNPHAGENGLFGNEEHEIIIPAIKECIERGIKVEGPIAPDTVFLRALKGEFDIVVAMYHDQGHIPIKLLAFDTGVNITVGLDIVRVSVDHGTAFDIAGKLKATAGSLVKAVEIGKKLSL